MPNSNQPQIYFSIDYRSPPSGMGQIVDTTQPEKIGDKWNYINVDYGDETQESYDHYSGDYYVKNKYFHSMRAAQEGWAGPVIKEIITFLRESGVTHVQDNEAAYEYPGADPRGFFTLERWANIYLNPQQ